MRNFRNEVGGSMENKKYPKAQDLYVDLDGVLVSLKYPDCEPYPKLVSVSTEFMEWALNTFDKVRFLTCWSEDAIRKELPDLPKLEVCKWKSEKTEAIDFSRSFYWLEDGITWNERRVLEDKGLEESYVFIDPDDDTALVKFMERYG
jgi:hypothetical protein